MGWLCDSGDGSGGESIYGGLFKGTIMFLVIVIEITLVAVRLCN